MKKDFAITELEFRCGICEQWLLLDHLAFTYDIDEGKEGVCGFCADQE